MDLFERVQSLLADFEEMISPWKNAIEAYTQTQIQAPGLHGYLIQLYPIYRNIKEMVAKHTQQTHAYLEDDIALCLHDLDIYRDRRQPLIDEEIARDGFSKCKYAFDILYDVLDQLQVQSS